MVKDGRLLDHRTLFLMKQKHNPHVYIVLLYTRWMLHCRYKSLKMGKALKKTFKKRNNASVPGAWSSGEEVEGND